MAKIHKLATAILITFGLCLPLGVQAKDRKIISSAICQAMTPDGAAKLRHNGSSLEAVDVGVTVICPIIKDQHGPMQLVEVRHLKPSGPANNVEVSGEVFSCSTTGGCSVAKQTIQQGAPTGLRSMIFNPLNLPDGDDRYYYYKSVLPANWKIVAFIYRQS